MSVTGKSKPSLILILKCYFKASKLNFSSDEEKMAAFKWLHMKLDFSLAGEYYYTLCNLSLAADSFLSSPCGIYEKQSFPSNQRHTAVWRQADFLSDVLLKSIKHLPKFFSLHTMCTICKREMEMQN